MELARSGKMNWTKEFELEYWTAHKDEEYLTRCENKYKIFDIDGYFDKKVDLAVDVGGGKFGGALYYFKRAKRKVLIDALAKEYIQMNTIPEDVIALSSDFSSLPLEDNSVDVLFAWSVLCHSLTKEHFYKGQAELVRVLKGLLFFEQRLLKKPCQGHTLVLSKEEILDEFGRLIKLKEIEAEDRIYVVYRLGN